MYSPGAPAQRERARPPLQRRQWRKVEIGGWGEEEPNVKADKCAGVEGSSEVVED